MVVLAAANRERASGIARTLESYGLDVRIAHDGREAERIARVEAPELIFVVAGLPDLSAVGLCKTLREDPAVRDVPILLQMDSDAEVDRILALEAGADDVVSSLVSNREAALRARAILRHGPRATPPATQDRLTLGELSLDLSERTLRAGEDVPALTRREFDLLAFLMRNKDRALRREQTLESVWGRGSDAKPRVVDTYVKILRRKLGPLGACIDTLRGVGYRLSGAPSAPAPPPQSEVQMGDARRSLRRRAGSRDRPPRSPWR